MTNLHIKSLPKFQWSISIFQIVTVTHFEILHVVTNLCENEHIPHLMCSGVFPHPHPIPTNPKIAR